MEGETQPDQRAKQWADASEHLDWNERRGNVNHTNSMSRIAEVKISRGSRCTIHKDGGLVLQGEIVDFQRDGPTLFVEGTRHYWNEGPEKDEGIFAVMVNNFGVEVDGPTSL